MPPLMALFSFLKRGNSTGAVAASPEGDEVQQLRSRARRRLIGAAVLVAIGVVGFPLIFETQPRPIPIDLPIEIPRKETAPALVVPTAAAPVPVPAPVPAASLPAPIGAELPVERAEVKASQPAPDKPVEKAAEKVAEKPVEKKPLVPPPTTARPDAARAQALLEGRQPPPKASEAASGARFIVQAGAFGEAKAAQELRNKVEKLGLKTYAQEVQTADGRRIRVRLGPFVHRDEAERAAAKLRAAGLAGAILTL